MKAIAIYVILSVRLGVSHNIMLVVLILSVYLQFEIVADNIS